MPAFCIPEIFRNEGQCIGRHGFGTAYPVRHGGGSVTGQEKQEKISRKGAV